MDIESEYLGISEAAEYLRVSASTLRRWEKKGFLIPERTPTGIRRYTRQQLDNVLNAPDHSMHAHMQIPIMEEDSAEQNKEHSEETVETIPEDYNHDYYSDNAGSDAITSASQANIVSHRYNPPPVFDNNEFEDTAEPSVTVLESNEEHLSVQDQLNQLVNAPAIDETGLNTALSDIYTQENEPESEFLESAYRQNIDGLSSTPSLDNYLARPLTIDGPHVHFDNESFHQNEERSTVNESTARLSLPVHEQPETRRTLRSFGMFIGIFAGFLLVAMLAWFVYSNFISGQQNELLRPVI
jgi:DNA-binding transcriptional MerR regulator